MVTFILVASYVRAKLLCSCFFCILNNLCLWKSLQVCWTWVWCVSGCSGPPRTSPRSGTLCWWTPAGPRPAACRPETAQIHRNIQILVFNGTTEPLQHRKTGNTLVHIMNIILYNLYRYTIRITVWEFAWIKSVLMFLMLLLLISLDFKGQFHFVYFCFHLIK